MLMHFITHAPDVGLPREKVDCRNSHAVFWLSSTIEPAPGRPIMTQKPAIYRIAVILGFFMKASFANQTALGLCAVALCCVSIMMKNGAAFSQTTGTVDSAPTVPPANEDAPAGGCMPIGLTASGEIVFPIQCKEFIERARGKTVEPQPIARGDEPAGDQQREVIAPTTSESADKPVEADKPVVTSALPRRVERKQRVKESNDCTRYSTYDKASGTYKGYDGRRRSCVPRESVWRK